MGNIPTQVEEQEKQAEELLKKMLEESEEEETSYNEETSDEETSNEETQNTSVSAPSHNQESDWEHKYKVLMGKYNAEVPALHQQIKQLTAQVEQLTEKLNKVSVNTGSTQQNDFITNDFDLKEFMEQYPELYSAIEKLIQAKYEPKIKQLEEELMKTSKVAGSVVQNTFYTQLDSLIPEWRTINNDPEFAKWLQNIEPYSGSTKYDLLMNRFNNGDAQGVAFFFKQYLAETKKTSNKIVTYPEPNKPSATTKQANSIQDLDAITSQIKEALARRDYKKADDLEKKIDEILLNFKT